MVGKRKKPKPIIKCPQCPSTQTIELGTIAKPSGTDEFGLTKYQCAVCEIIFTQTGEK